VFAPGESVEKRALALWFGAALTNHWDRKKRRRLDTHS
jgi:hypothetical protein